MTSRSTASLPHSEALISSATFSSLASSASQARRHTRPSRRGSRGDAAAAAAVGALPPRSVEVTEAPHDERHDVQPDKFSNSVASSCDEPVTLTTSSNSSNSSSSAWTNNSAVSREEEQAVQQDDARRAAAPSAETPSSSDSYGPRDAQKRQDVQLTNADQPNGEVRRRPSSSSFTPAISATTSSSMSLSFQHGSSPAAQPPSPPHSSPPSPSPAPHAISAEKLLSHLTSAQLETALQLYVDRGGIHAREVPALLATLPWCATVPAQPSPFIHESPVSSRGSASAAASSSSSPFVSPSASPEVDHHHHHHRPHQPSQKDESGNSNSDSAAPSSALLDPEGWLCAVARATASAAATGLEAPTNTNPIASIHAEAGPGNGEASVASLMPPPSFASDVPARKPIALVCDRYGSFFAAEESSGGVSSSPHPPPPLASAVSDEKRQTHPAQQGRKNVSGGLRGAPPTPTGRKLAYDIDVEEDDRDDESYTDEEEDEDVLRGAEQPRSSLPELLPRPASNSLRSFASQTTPSLTSPQASRPPFPAPPHSQPQQKPSPALNHARPPRSSAPPLISPLHSSLSPEPHYVSPSEQSARHLGTQQQQRQQTRDLSAASARSTSAAMTAAEEAGMRHLFQRCLCTPLAESTAMIAESDWVTLIDTLRHDGHRKLPPQPILDHVTHTIAESMRRRGRSVGLNMRDFAEVLQAELDEIRRDLTASGDSTERFAGRAPDAVVRVEFPARPNYLFTNFVGAPTGTSGAATGKASLRRPSSNSVGAASSRVNPSSLASTLDSTGGTQGTWRVLPTWCMALAGLFPVEVSSICPMPVVRYLRSVALTDAVLEALVQRLELEVDTMTDPTAATTGGVGAQPARTVPPLLHLLEDAQEGQRLDVKHHVTPQPQQQPQKQLQLVLKTTEPSTAPSHDASSAFSVPSPVGVTDFVWPPRAGSFASLSLSGGQPPSQTTLSGLTGHRPTSSLVVTSLSRDGTSWREHTEWRPPSQLGGGAAGGAATVLATAAGGGGGSEEGVLLVDTKRTNANTSLQDVAGSWNKVPAAASAAAAVAHRRVPSATSTPSLSAGSSHRYLEERPLDEVSASVVARAKARRLMDALRKNTVPINRYECFARVEHEDEPMQEPLCFVTKAELKKTLGGSDGDDDSVDSDAMSDMIGTLTYDPADEDNSAAIKKKKKKANGASPDTARNEGIGERERNDRNSAAAGTATYVEMNRAGTTGPRMSIRPVQLPRVSVANLLPNVFAAPTRASMLVLQQQHQQQQQQRARAASADPTHQNLETREQLDGGNSGVGPRRSIASLRLAAPELESRPPLPPAAAPPPVPGMYRMTGVLIGALPKKQEAALVERLSHPTFDPRTMGLRAASANAAAGRASGKGSGKVGSVQRIQSADACHHDRHRTPERVMASPPQRYPSPYENKIARLHSPHGTDLDCSPTSPLLTQRSRHRGTTDESTRAHNGGMGSSSNGSASNSKKDANESGRQSARSQRATPPPPPPPQQTASSPSPSRLTPVQTRGFCCFKAPSVLVDDPLSPAAAASAMTQVMMEERASATAATVAVSKRPQPPSRAPRFASPRDRPSAALPARRSRARCHPRSASAHHSRLSTAAEPKTSAAVPIAERPTRQSPQLRSMSGRRKPPRQQSGGRAPRQPSARGAGRRAPQLTPQPPHPQRQPTRPALAGAKQQGFHSSVQASAATAAAAACLERNAAAVDAAHRTSPTPAEMSLYERRLLRRLQRAYAAERGVTD